MKLQPLNTALFTPLDKGATSCIFGGEDCNGTYSGKGDANIDGKVVPIANDCYYVMDDGRWHVTYTLPDGTGVIREF